MTVHRAANTDDPARLREIVPALNTLDEPVVFPVHPRTQAALPRRGRAAARPMCGSIDPVGPLDMLRAGAAGAADPDRLGRGAKRSLLAGRALPDPARGNRVGRDGRAQGWNCLVGTDPARIAAAVATFAPQATPPALFGDGHAAEAIHDFGRDWGLGVGG